MFFLSSVVLLDILGPRFVGLNYLLFVYMCAISLLSLHVAVCSDGLSDVGLSSSNPGLEWSKSWIPIFFGQFQIPQLPVLFSIGFFFFNRGSGTCIYFDKCCFAIQSSWTIVFTAFLYLLPPDNSLFSWVLFWVLGGMGCRTVCPYKLLGPEQFP